MAVKEIASGVDICNLALAHLDDARRITGFNEPHDIPSQECGLHYDNTRKYLLRKYQWNFAVVWLSFNELPDLPLARYTAKFKVPGNVMRIIEVDGLAEDEWERMGNDELHCNAVAGAPLKVKVIVDVEDVRKYDDMFISAFSYLLASRIGAGISASEEAINRVKNEYKEAVSGAKIIDAFERRDPPSEYVSKFITARY